MLLVRHASAGDREEWEGDDKLRPLDAKGRARAQDLVALLGDYQVGRILSSPALRCVQTVDPLGHAIDVEVELRDELSEENQWAAGAELVRSLAGHDVVVCGHGGLDDVLPEHPKWKKGAVFVVEGDLSVVDVL
jgi:phosphohistidine phosphatase SixA